MNLQTVKRCTVGVVLASAATLPGFPQLHTSVEGLKMIADYEGCRLKPYLCDAGKWTDGIGNTVGVVPGRNITERQAAGNFITNVLRVEAALARCAAVSMPQPRLRPRWCRLPSTSARATPAAQRWWRSSNRGAGAMRAIASALECNEGRI